MKPFFWKSLVVLISTHQNIVQRTKQRKMCYILKQIMLERLGAVSDHALRKFFEWQIHVSSQKFLNKCDRYFTVVERNNDNNSNNDDDSIESDSSDEPGPGVLSEPPSDSEYKLEEIEPPTNIINDEQYINELQSAATRVVISNAKVENWSVPEPDHDDHDLIEQETLEQDRQLNRLKDISRNDMSDFTRIIYDAQFNTSSNRMLPQDFEDFSDPFRYLSRINIEDDNYDDENQYNYDDYHDS
jgi:hypothetical protein